MTALFEGRGGANTEFWQPIVSGNRWPGEARVEGCDVAYDWEVKKGKGTDGGTTTFNGGALAEPKITFIMWRGTDGLSYCNYFETWERYRGLFVTPAGLKDPPALVIEHPQFALAKIGAVVVKRIGDLKITPGGMGECTVEFLEFRPPKPALGTVKQTAEQKKYIHNNGPMHPADIKRGPIDQENELLWEEIMKP